MIHKGKENGILPRIQIEVTKDLKIALSHYSAAHQKTLKQIVTELVQGLIDGKFKL